MSRRERGKWAIWNRGNLMHGAFKAAKRWAERMNGGAA